MQFACNVPPVSGELKNSAICIKQAAGAAAFAAGKMAYSKATRCAEEGITVMLWEVACSPDDVKIGDIFRCACAVTYALKRKHFKREAVRPPDASKPPLPYVPPPRAREAVCACADAAKCQPSGRRRRLRVRSAVRARSVRAGWRKAQAAFHGCRYRANGPQS